MQTLTVQQLALSHDAGPTFISALATTLQAWSHKRTSAGTPPNHDSLRCFTSKYCAGMSRETGRQHPGEPSRGTGTCAVRTPGAAPCTCSVLVRSCGTCMRAACTAPAAPSWQLRTQGPCGCAAVGVWSCCRSASSLEGISAVLHSVQHQDQSSSHPCTLASCPLCSCWQTTYLWPC